MDRTFKQSNAFPNCPRRPCLKSTGPFEVSFTSRAMARNTGERTINAKRLPKISIALFTMKDTFFVSCNSGCRDKAWDSPRCRNRHRLIHPKKCGLPHVRVADHLGLNERQAV